MKPHPHFSRDSNPGTIASEVDQLLDARKAAELLSVKASTLYQWAYERKIAVVKLGRALRFRRSVLLKLIADSERPALPLHKRQRNETDEQRTVHDAESRSEK